jgi:hypothetical protein
MTAIVAMTALPVQAKLVVCLAFQDQQPVLPCNTVKEAVKEGIYNRMRERKSVLDQGYTKALRAKFRRSLQAWVF